MSDLVMFDFDGVIADSLQAMHRATVRALRENGLDDLATGDVVLRIVETNWFEGLRRLGVPPEVVRYMDDLIAEGVSAGEVEPFDGIPDVVAALAKRDCVVIVTSNRSDIVQEFLSQWDIGGVTEVLGGDKGESKVPKLRAAVDRHPHDEAWFIGDSVGDIVEGREAGVSTVAATWGWHAEERLLAASPDRVARAPRDLLRLLL
ncbi:MAG TPA: HAD family hydrolase [Thermoleophilia bacterium]|nr:HAD family hydrolase [Thermoleophilia bacterium]